MRTLKFHEVAIIAGGVKNPVIVDECVEKGNFLGAFGGLLIGFVWNKYKGALIGYVGGCVMGSLLGLIIGHGVASFYSD